MENMDNNMIGIDDGVSLDWANSIQFSINRIKIVGNVAVFSVGYMNGDVERERKRERDSMVRLVDSVYGDLLFCV